MPDEWLISFILSYGEHAQVVDPTALRLDVANLKKYRRSYKT